MTPIEIIIILVAISAVLTATYFAVKEPNEHMYVKIEDHYKVLDEKDRLSKELQRAKVKLTEAEKEKKNLATEKEKSQALQTENADLKSKLQQLQAANVVMKRQLEELQKTNQGNYEAAISWKQTSEVRQQSLNEVDTALTMYMRANVKDKKEIERLLKMLEAAQAQEAAVPQASSSSSLSTPVTEKSSNRPANPLATMAQAIAQEAKQVRNDALGMPEDLKPQGPQVITGADGNEIIVSSNAKAALMREMEKAQQSQERTM